MIEMVSNEKYDSSRLIIILKKKKYLIFFSYRSFKYSTQAYIREINEIHAAVSISQFPNFSLIFHNLRNYLFTYLEFHLFSTRWRRWR